MHTSVRTSQHFSAGTCYGGKTCEFLLCLCNLSLALLILLQKSNLPRGSPRPVIVCSPLAPAQMSVRGVKTHQHVIIISIIINAGTDVVGTWRAVSAYGLLAVLILLLERKLAVERSELVVCLYDGHRPTFVPRVEHIVIMTSVITTNRALRCYNAGRAS